MGLGMGWGYGTGINEGGGVYNWVLIGSVGELDRGV